MADAVSESSTAPKAGSRWRRFLFDLHSWCGIVAGIFLILIATSGALAVFKTEIDWLLTPALRIAPTANPVSMQAVRESVERTFPRAWVNNVDRPYGRRFAYVVQIYERRVGGFEVFVDPGTGAVRGLRRTEGYTATVAVFLRQFHVRLLMGTWGRLFVGCGGAAIFLLAVTGFLVMRQRRKSLFRVRGARTSRVFWADIHRVTALWTLVFHILVAVTGAVLGWEGIVPLWQRNYGRHPRRAAVAQSAPAVLRAKGGGAVDGVRRRYIALDEAAAIAERAVPGTHTQGIEVTDEGLNVVLTHDAALIRHDGSYAFIDPLRGDVLEVHDLRRGRFWSRVYDTFDPLHFGYFGDVWGAVAGYAVRALWVLFGLAPGVLALSGAVAWWKRRGGPKRATAATKGAARTVRGGWYALGAWLALVFVAARIIARGHPELVNPVGLVEHAFAKPLALAMLAFPVTTALAWLAWKLAVPPRGVLAARAASLGAGAILGAWHLWLALLFLRA